MYNDTKQAIACRLEEWIKWIRTVFIHQEQYNTKITEEIDVASQLKRAITCVSDRLRTKLMPVDRKVLTVSLSHLLELQESLWKKPDLCKTHGRKIFETLKLVHNKLNDNEVWDVADFLKELLPFVASDDWVYRALLEEKGRPLESALRWSILCDDNKLNKFIDSYDRSLDKSDWNVARQILSALYAKRDNAGRHERARERLRVMYLKCLGIIIVSLLSISVAVMLVWKSKCISSPIIILFMPFIMVFLAGGLGALLSGTIRIRDVDRIIQIDKQWKTILVQAALGGTLAVLVLVTLQTRLIQLGTFDVSGTSNPEMFYLLGFISGYSEPFALSLFKKIVDLGK